MLQSPPPPLNSFASHCPRGADSRFRPPNFTRPLLSRGHHSSPEANSYYHLANNPFCLSNFTLPTSSATPNSVPKPFPPQEFHVPSSTSSFPTTTLARGVATATRQYYQPPAANISVLQSPQASPSAGGRTFFEPPLHRPRRDFPPRRRVCFTTAWTGRFLEEARCYKPNRLFRYYSQRSVAFRAIPFW